MIKNSLSDRDRKQICSINKEAKTYFLNKKSATLDDFFVSIDRSDVYFCLNYIFKGEFVKYIKRFYIHRIIKKSKLKRETNLNNYSKIEKNNSIKKCEHLQPINNNDWDYFQSLKLDKFSLIVNFNYDTCYNSWVKKYKKENIIKIFHPHSLLEMIDMNLLNNENNFSIKDNLLKIKD